MNINFGATKGLVVGKKTTQSKDGNNTYYKLLKLRTLKCAYAP